MLIVTEARAVSHEPVNPRLWSGRARWRDAGRLAEDWRQALLRAQWPSALAQLTPAAIAARSVGASEGGSWLAAPVHLQAGLDRVHLPMHGVLRLADAELQSFAAAFNAQLGTPSLQLRVLSGGGFVLSGLDAPRAVTSDPATILGADVREAVPRGVEAAPLRALSGEIEMWLHEHPLNLARQRRGELPVSSLWLWGGAEPLATGPLVRALPVGAPAWGGEDAWLRAVARVAAPEGRGTSADFATLQALGADCGIVAVSATRGLDEWHAAWLEPARTALAARQVGRLTLWVEGRILTLVATSSWHYWRPARHWLEFLQ